MVTSEIGSEIKSSKAISSYSKVEIPTRLSCLKDIWEPVHGECLVLFRDLTNVHDDNTIAVTLERNGTVVGHVPFNLAPIISHFLRRSCNKEWN